jgi:hypothetical protein
MASYKIGSATYDVKGPIMIIYDIKLGVKDVFK